KFCRAKNPETLPVRKSSPRTKRLIENHSLIVSRSRILLQKADRSWRGLWILPLLQKSPANQQSIYKGIFPFTNHRITLNVFAQRQHKIDRRLQRWIKINSLESIPIPSAHRRALRHLLNGHRQNYMTVDRSGFLCDTLLRRYMRSMTGYGRAETDHAGTRFSVE